MPSRRHGVRGLRRARGHPRGAGRTSPSCARPFRRSARRCGPQSGPGRSGRRLEAASRDAEPQAVVINSGVANAATGERGRRGRAGDRRRGRGGCSTSCAEQVLVLSTGVIGSLLPMEKVLGGRARRRAPRSQPTAGRRRRGDPHDRHAGRRRQSSRGRRVRGRRDGEGRRDDPPAARDDACGRHDRLPARAGRGASVPAAGGRARASTASRSTASARRTMRSCLLANGASGVERTHGDDERFAHALAEVCAARASRSSPTARARRCFSEIDVSGAASDPEAEAVARRIATSPLVKTAAFGRDPNWGRVLAAAGSAPWNGGFAHVESDSAHGLVQRVDGASSRASRSASSPSLGGSAAGSTSTSASGRGAPRTSRRT